MNALVTGFRFRLWPRVLRWRFLVFQRRRCNRLTIEQVAGRQLVVLPQVFNPKLFFTGELLAAYLDRRPGPEGGAVLDMGTGSGIGAVAAARWAGRVVAVDINPAAVRCAKINALLNGVESRVDVRHGDLFAPLGDERFDLVLFNPPYYRGEPKDDLDRAFRSTQLGERFAAGLRAHLTPAGRLLLLLSTTGDEPGFLDPLRSHGFSIAPAARRRLISETLTIYEVRQSVEGHR